MSDIKNSWKIVSTDNPTGHHNRNTYVIPTSELKGKKVLAMGWKMLNENYTSAYSDYEYKEGKVYTVDSIIAPRRYGLHFCLNPISLLDYCDENNHNFKIAKVKAYDEIKELDNCDLVVAQTLKIIKIYNFDEYFSQFINKYSRDNKGCKDSNGCKEVEGGYCSDFCLRSKGLSETSAICDGQGVHLSRYIYMSQRCR